MRINLSFMFTAVLVLAASLPLHAEEHRCSMYVNFAELQGSSQKLGEAQFKPLLERKGYDIVTSPEEARFVIKSNRITSTEKWNWSITGLGLGYVDVSVQEIDKDKATLASTQAPKSYQADVVEHIFGKDSADEKQRLRKIAINKLISSFPDCASRTIETKSVAAEKQTTVDDLSPIEL